MQWQVIIRRNVGQDWLWMWHLSSLFLPDQHRLAGRELAEVFRNNLLAFTCLLGVFDH